MGVDYRDFRASAIGIAVAPHLVLALMDVGDVAAPGVIAQKARQSLAFCYVGIAAAAPVANTAQYLMLLGVGN